MHTVLITASSFAARGVELLKRDHCRILYANGEAEIGQIMARERVDAVISRTLRLREAAIASCATLKVISKHGAGYDNVDIAAATRMNIPVFHTPGANSQSVVELVFGLILAAARTLPVHDRALRASGWSRAEVGLQLSGRTLGIVGLGNIGGKVARLGAAFGMHVIGYDPYVPNPPCPTVDSLGALLPQAQILTLHCPLTTETRGMLGARELALLPVDAIVINTARGGIVDEVALALAIDSHKVLGAGFDVFEAEPMEAGHPFHTLSRVVMTPHVGGSTRESLDAVAIQSVQNALNFLNRRPFDPALVVNPSTLSGASHRVDG